MRLVICFLLLPLLPLVALVLAPEGHIPVVPDRIVVIVLAAIVAAVISATIAYRARRELATVIL